MRRFSGKCIENEGTPTMIDSTRICFWKGRMYSSSPRLSVFFPNSAGTLTCDTQSSLLFPSLLRCFPCHRRCRVLPAVHGWVLGVDTRCSRSVGGYPTVDAKNSASDSAGAVKDTRHAKTPQYMPQVPETRRTGSRCITGTQIGDGGLH